jgi:hypothetical protein
MKSSQNISVCWSVPATPIYNSIYERRYAKDDILHIEDISEFVHQQYPNRLVRNQENLLVPSQSVYLVDDLSTIKKIGLL